MKKLLKILLCFSLMIGTSVSYADGDLQLVGQSSFSYTKFQIDPQAEVSKITGFQVVKKGEKNDYTKLESEDPTGQKQYRVYEGGIIGCSTLENNDILIFDLSGTKKAFKLNKPDTFSNGAYTAINIQDINIYQDVDTNPHTVDVPLVNVTYDKVELTINSNKDRIKKIFLNDQLLTKTTSYIPYSSEYKENDNGFIINRIQDKDKLVFKAEDDTVIGAYRYDKAKKSFIAVKITHLEASSTTNELQEAQTVAKKEIEQAAETKKQEIKAGNASQEAQQKANQAVEVAKTSAKEKISEANSTELVEQAKTQGLSAINTVKVPTKAAEDAENLKSAKEAANAKIDQAAEEKKQAIQSSEALEEAKNTAKQKVDTVVSEEKEKVNSSETADAAKQAGEAGVAKVGEIEVPTKVAEGENALQKAQESANQAIDEAANNKKQAIQSSGALDESKTTATKAVETAVEAAKAKVLEATTTELVEQAKTEGLAAIEKVEVPKKIEENHNSGSISEPSSNNTTTQTEEESKDNEAKPKEIKLIKSKLEELKNKLYGLKWVAKVSPSTVKTYEKEYDETVLSVEKAIKNAEDYLAKYGVETEDDKVEDNDQKKVIMVKLEELKNKVYGLKWVAKTSPTIVKNRQKEFNETILRVEKAIKIAEAYLQKH